MKSYFLSLMFVIFLIYNMHKHVFITANSISTSKGEVILPRKLALVASQNMASISVNTGN